MPSSLQLRFDLRDARWRPVLDVNGAQAALDLEAEEVIDKLDLGQLVGFNIALDRNGRRELRILAASIEHYRVTLGSRPFELSWPKIFRLIIPHDKPVIAGTEIDRGLNCDPDHRLNLIRAERFRLADPRAEVKWRRGPGGAPAVSRDSFERFLISRLTPN